MFSGLVCTFNQLAKCNSKHSSKQEALNLVIQMVLQLQMFPKFLFLQAESCPER